MAKHGERGPKDIPDGNVFSKPTAAELGINPKDIHEGRMLHHQQACEIRLRAERKAGQILAKMEKPKGNAGKGRPAKGGRSSPPPKPSSQPKTLSQQGISKEQSSQWQKLAKVPEEQFEAALPINSRPGYDAHQVGDGGDDEALCGELGEGVRDFRGAERHGRDHCRSRHAP